MTRSSVPCCAEPWAGVPGGVVREALAREYTRWAVDLGWDLSRDWAAVEPARRAGLVPGWVVSDGAGALAGWAFAAEHDSALMLGALVADDEEVARALLRSARTAAGDRPLGGFFRVGGAVTPTWLENEGCRVQVYEYLVCRVRPSRGGEPDGVSPLSRWTDADAQAVATLLAAAYRSDTSLRPFATSGTPGDWLDYVDALTRRPGCGIFSPACSATVPGDTGLRGAVLVTSVGPTTAHLAQIAVSPAARGLGLGAQLLAHATERVSCVLGASRLSLMVSTANGPAQRLYARLGFRQQGAFVAIGESGKLETVTVCR